MKHRRVSAILISLVLVLTACGQTGELRLPDAAAETPGKAEPRETAPTADSASENDGPAPANEDSETEVN